MDELAKQLQSQAVSFFVVRAAELQGKRIADFIQKASDAQTKEDENFWVEMIDKEWDKWNLSVSQAYPNNQSMVNHLAELVDFHINSVHKFQSSGLGVKNDLTI